MERSDYWGALVRGWWLIVIFGLIGLGVGLLGAHKHVPKTTSFFQSTSSIGSPPTSPGSPFGGGVSTDQILYFATTDGVFNQASQLSGLNLPPSEIRAEISLLGPATQGSSSGTQPGIIDVTAVGPTAAQALAVDSAFDNAMNDQLQSTAKGSLLSAETQTEATLANVMNLIATKSYPTGVTVQALQDQINSLDSYLATLVVSIPSTGFDILQEPSAATTYEITSGTSAVNNSKVRLLAGLLIGLIVGAAAAMGLWLLDKRLKTATRARAAFGYPVIAEIPTEASDSTEPYRMLWLSVFREPLPLPPMEGPDRLYEGEDPVLDSGVGSRSGPAGSR